MVADHLNITISKGELFGLVGPSGAGKTTTIKMVYTLLLPTSGTVSVGGHDILEEQMRTLRCNKKKRQIIQERPNTRRRLNRVLDAARIAPSGGNRQPWKFILIKDDTLKQKMISICNNQKFIANAPLIVVACGQKLSINRGGYMGEMGMLLDVSIAFTHLILAARAEGLGTCWIGAFNNKEIKKILEVPDGYEVVAATPLGYPSEDVFTEPKKQKKLGRNSISEQVLNVQNLCTTTPTWSVLPSALK